MSGVPSSVTVAFSTISVVAGREDLRPTLVDGRRHPDLLKSSEYRIDPVGVDQAYVHERRAGQEDRR